LKLSEAIDMLTKINRSDTKRVICDKIHFELETAFSNIHEISHMRWDVFEQTIQFRRITKTEMMND
jgi:hypothetical protein